MAAGFAVIQKSAGARLDGLARLERRRGSDLVHFEV